MKMNMHIALPSRDQEAMPGLDHIASDLATVPAEWPF